MKVYKFGGASVRNADGVQNLLKIIGDERDLFIIVSAMGKTTNALEKVFEGLQKGDKAFSMEHITALRQYHAEIVNELYGAPTRLECKFLFINKFKLAVTDVTDFYRKTSLLLPTKKSSCSFPKRPLSFLKSS